MEFTLSEFLLTITAWIVDAAYIVLGWGESIVNSLPADWPQWVKYVAAFAIVILILQIIVWMITRIADVPMLFVALPSALFRRFWLKYTSPYGNAKWASRRILKKTGHLKPHGLFLGQWRKWFSSSADIYHHGEGHFVTIAAPGGGKSTSVLVPSLLTCKTGSFVVTDPKGELTAITRRYRESVGRVLCLNPFFKDFELGTGLKYEDSGFNPFDMITDDENTPAQASNFARLLSVTDRKDSGSYFQDDGAELLALIITWMVKYEVPENRNLSYLYELVRTDTLTLFKHMKHVNDPVIVHDANRFSDMATNSSGQWQGVISKAQLATKRYVPTTPLANHTNKGKFDPKWLKEENITIYVLVPTKHIQTAAPWLNMVMGLLCESVGNIGEARPVTFLLDELPALGYLPDLRRQMRQYRGSGLRMWLFSQTVAALSDPEMYGKEGLKDLMGLCDTKQFFSIREKETARDVSEMVGERTRLNRNLQAKSEDTGFTTIGVPLIRPESVISLKNGQQIIIRPNVPPIKAALVPYFTRKSWQKITDKNPYREK